MLAHEHIEAQADVQTSGALLGHRLQAVDNQQPGRLVDAVEEVDQVGLRALEIRRHGHHAEVVGSFHRLARIGGVTKRDAGLLGVIHQFVDNCRRGRAPIKEVTIHKTLPARPAGFHARGQQTRARQQIAMLPDLRTQIDNLGFQFGGRAAGRPKHHPNNGDVQYQQRKRDKTCHSHRIARRPERAQVEVFTHAG